MVPAPKLPIPTQGVIMSLHTYDCLRCLCYVIMRSQLTFSHTPFAPMCLYGWINTFTFFSLSLPACDFKKCVCMLARNLKEVVLFVCFSFLFWDRHFALKLSILDGVTILQFRRSSMIWRMWLTLAFNTGRSRHRRLHGMENSSSLGSLDWLGSLAYVLKEKSSIEAKHKMYWEYYRITSF